MLREVRTSLICSQSSWAKKEISDLVDKGIVKGMSETSFAPNNNISRQEMKQNGEVFYGPVEYEFIDYFGYIYSNEKEVVDYVTVMAPLVCVSVILDSIQGVLIGNNFTL